MPQARRPLIAVSVALICAASACAAAPSTRAAAPSAPVEPPLREMVFPLASAVKFSDTFGAARSGGRAHEGQDLMAPKGTVAVAAASGTVTYLRHSSDGLSGNMLRITDADGWQYVYIHINNDHPGTDDGANVYEQAFVDGIRSGQQVVAGEPVAYVGDSGNAETTGSHLHFELHRPDGSAANAYSSLRAARVAPLTTAAVEAAAPFGAVDDLASGAPGAVHLAGWALDRVSNAPVAISVYVDGNPLAALTTADGARPDIDVAFPGRGPAHGFDATVGGVPAGAHRICLVAHNSGSGGGSARLRCEQITVG